MKCPYSFIIDGNGGFHHLDYAKALDITSGIVVPCGKCLVCRQNRAAEWATRLTHELQYYQESCFLTLTYNDDYLPIFSSGLPTLWKPDFQNFMKRYRKKIDQKIKYFACGEYGSKTQRPHYHAIILGWQPPGFSDLEPAPGGRFSSKIIQSLWPLGFNTISNATTESIHYTSGYILKKQIRKNDPEEDRTPEFLLSSNGIGEQYALDHIEELRNLMCNAEGVTSPIPRYYIDKIGGINTAKIAGQKTEKQQAFLRRFLKTQDISKLDYIDQKRILRQVAKAKKLGEAEITKRLAMTRRKHDV